MHLHQIVGAEAFRKYAIPDTEDPKAVFESCKCEEKCVPPNTFCISKKLGEGAFGIIYKCSLRGRTVAAKKLKDHVLIKWRLSDSLSFSERDHSAIQAYKDLVTELAVLSSMGQHPNLVQFYGACLADETNPIIFEEFVSGPSLASFYSRKPQWQIPWIPPRSVTYSWVMDMMLGLEFLHNRDPEIIHRDIKPGNLLLTKDLTRLKIADFGMCKIVKMGESGADVGNTGSETYMAPEVFHKDQTQYTDKVDIYSAAVIMWSIASGEGHTLHHRGEDSTWRPDLGWVEWDVLRPIIEKSWSQLPEQRPSASQIVAQLRSLYQIPPPISPMDFGPPGCQCSIM